MTTRQNKTVWLTGASGFIGGRVVAAIEAQEDVRLLTTRRADLDLSDAEAVCAFIDRNQPEVIIHLAAAAAGSVELRRRPVHYGLANIQTAHGLLTATERGLVPRLIVAGSAGEYPRLAALGEAPRGLRPVDLWRGPAAAGGYGQARRLISQWALDAAAGAGTEAAVLVLPTVYGPGDGGPAPVARPRLRALPAFAARMLAGGPVEHWGSGFEARDFLHVADAAAAFVAAMDAPIAGMRLHVSDGAPVTMAALSELIAQELGFHGAQSWRHRAPGQITSEDRVWLEPTGLYALGYRPNRALSQALAEALDDLRGRLAATDLEL